MWNVPCSGYGAPRWLNLYILEFDNLRSDPSIGWLGSGFVDMLKKDFIEIDGVRVLGRAELEQILQDRSVFLRQPSGTRNILVMGSFIRDLDRVTVSIQLLNIENWQEVDKLSAVGTLNQISALGSDVFGQVVAKLRGQIPPQERGVLRPPLARAQPPEYRDQVRDMSSSMSRAIEGLEESMDVYIGAREKVQGSGESKGQYFRDFSFTASGVVEEKPSKEAEMLTDILERISKNPYLVEIGVPSIKIDENRKDRLVELSIPVTYSLRENLIKDMLSSLPYTGVRQDGSVTSLEFSRRKFGVSEDLVENISLGRYRVAPVVKVLDRTGNIRRVILDSSDPYWHKYRSKNVSFSTEHIFSPLVAFSVSGWSLQVTMESVGINATYIVEVPRHEVGDYSRVQVEFVPESELSEFLSQIL